MTWGTDLSQLPWELNITFPFLKVIFNVFSYIDFSRAATELSSSCASYELPVTPNPTGVDSEQMMEGNNHHRIGPDSECMQGTVPSAKLRRSLWLKSKNVLASRMCSTGML